MKIDLSKIRPLWDFCVVQLGSEPEGGIILPESAQSADNIATVLACGPGLPRWQDGVPVEAPPSQDGQEAVPTGYCAPIPVDPGDRVILAIPRDPRDGMFMDPDIQQIAQGVLLVHATHIAAVLDT